MMHVSPKGSKLSSKKALTVVVVIPYYNGSAFIERSVRSVLSQTLPPNEFVVVNDGSTKNETAFLHKLAKRLHFKVIDQANGGQGSARNAGVRASTSNYISFLDQDDFYRDTHVEALVRAIPSDDPHLGWVYGDLMEADGAGNVLRTATVKRHSAHPKRDIEQMVGFDMHVLPSASLISRTAYEAVGGFDPQFIGYEDDDLFLRIFRSGYSNYFVDQPVTVWCIRPNSTSYTVMMSRSRFRYFKKLQEMFPDDRKMVRYYMRDLLIPRFHSQFVHDAIRWAVQEDNHLPEHREELVSIFNGYGRAVFSNKSIPWRFKAKVWLERLVVNTNSKIVILTAIRLAHAARGLRVFFTQSLR
ncbi:MULTISPECIES: glycosyltransferase family A protein [unclassified Mesorhizobium]|uniref:glycosyltransferase family 2 protein n=1 Tax=unclassified Mesorhizobium TaxID=325217 RepID=UPI00333D613A